MNQERFWSMIEIAKSNTNSDYQMCTDLISELSKCSVADIVTWHNIYEEHLMASDKNLLKISNAIINNHDPEHNFMEFQAWLIAQGKETYFNALSDPNSLGTIIFDTSYGHEFLAYNEEISYASGIALEKKLGNVHPTEIFDFGEKSPLSPQELGGIHAGIQYSDNMDIKVPLTNNQNKLRELLPVLYDAMENIMSNPEPCWEQNSNQATEGKSEMEMG